MKNADLMTPNELRALANKIERENIVIPTKEGFLKCDLYEKFIDLYELENIVCEYQNCELIDLSKVKKLKTLIDKELNNTLKDAFNVVLKKGTKFYYYDNAWIDDNENYEMDEKWGKKYLENIREIE